MVGFAECEENAGEVLLARFRGTFKLCGKTCMDQKGCQSLTYFDNSDVCKLYSTPCFRNVASQIGFSLRVISNIVESTIKESTTVRSTSLQSLVPASIVFLGDFGQIIGAKRAKFLAECTDSVSSNGSVKCVDVRPGSIILDLKGSRAAVDAAVAQMKTNGLDLPSFTALLVRNASTSTLRLTTTGWSSNFFVLHIAMKL